MPQTNLFVNVNAPSILQALCRSLTDMTPLSFSEIAFGDNRQYNLFFVDGQGNYAPFSGSASYIPYIALGQFGQATGGTFTLTFGGNTTSALAWNASPAAVQTAFQALASVGANNCLVTGVAGEYYIFTFAGSLGNQVIAAITANASGLTPSSSLSINTTTVGSASPAANAVQTIFSEINPWTFANNWTPISNGWTGSIAANTVALLEALAASTSTNQAGTPALNGTLQITVQDPSSNLLTYLETPATVLGSLLNLNTLGSAQAPSFVTSAQLAAAVLGLNNFTRQDLTATSPGTTNVTPQTTSRNHTATIDFTGATAGTYNIVAQTSNTPQYGDQIILHFKGLAGIAGLILKIYSTSTAGTLVKTYTTDGTQRGGLFLLLGYNTTGTAWVIGDDDSNLMDVKQNLLGLTSTLTSKLNLKSIFSNVQVKTAAYTVVAADEGSLFKLSAAAAAFALTLPSASAVGSGFLLGLLKTDTSANLISTIPSTAALTAQNQFLLLESDGTVWVTLINCTPAGTPTPNTSQVPELSLPAVTALTGGTTGCLDAIPTAGGAVITGQIVEVTYLSGAINTTARYRLRAGTDAATAMFIVRPADYNGASNAFVWELLTVTRGTWPCTWNPDQAGFQQLVARGAAGSSALQLGAAFTFT